MNAERRRVLRYVKRILEEEPMCDVLTKRVAEQAYVSRSNRALVPELERFIVSTFDGPVEACVPNAEGANWVKTCAWRSHSHSASLAMPDPTMGGFAARPFDQR